MDVSFRLQQELKTEIFNCLCSDFYSLLAVRGVCKDWRESSRWVDSFRWDANKVQYSRCKLHNDFLVNCGCHLVSLDMILRNSHGFRKVKFVSDLPSSYIGGQYWLTDKLRVLVIELKSKLEHNLLDAYHKDLPNVLSTCSRLEQLSLGYFERLSSPQPLPFLPRLSKCYLRSVSTNASTLAGFFEASPLLEDVRLENIEITEGTLDIHLPSTWSLKINSIQAKEIRVHAPLLRRTQLHLCYVSRFIIEGTNLEMAGFSTLGPVTFTGAPLPKLQSLQVGKCWHKGWSSTFPMLKYLELHPSVIATEKCPLHRAFGGMNHLSHLRMNLVMLENLELPPGEQVCYLPNLKLLTVDASYDVFMSASLSDVQPSHVLNIIRSILSSCALAKLSIPIPGLSELSSQSLSPWELLHEFTPHNIIELVKDICREFQDRLVWGCTHMLI